MGNSQQKQQEPQQQEPKNQFFLQSASTIVVIPPIETCPQKIYQNIENITFYSNFDSGNLKSVFKQNDQYLLEIANDCEGRQPQLLFNKQCRNWFYFKVVSQIDQQIICIITNLAKKFIKPWKYDSDILIKQDGVWKRHPTEVKNLTLIFTLNLKSENAVKVAYSYPWTYKKNQKYLDKLQYSIPTNGVYFRREIMLYSLEGRKIELLTITNNNQLGGEFKFNNPKLFPGKVFQDFNKPYILMSCRVHPAETPASYVMKGFLDQLLNNSEESKFFLDNFVLLLIPMMNPDGVVRGHQRLDALGYDQNRVYNRLGKFNKFQGPYGVLELAKQFNIKYFIDLHAHTTYSNSFVFAGKKPNLDQQMETLILPYILSNYVSHFQFKPRSIFSEKAEQPQYQIDGQYTDNLKDLQDLNVYGNKEVSSNDNFPYPINQQLSGVAKKDVGLISNIPHCYTLEVNFKYFEFQGKQKYDRDHFLDLGCQLLNSLIRIKQMTINEYNDIKQIINQL